MFICWLYNSIASKTIQSQVCLSGGSKLRRMKTTKTLPFTTDEESIWWKDLRPRLADCLHQPFVFAVGSRGPEVTPLFAFLRIPQFFNAGENSTRAINHFSFSESRWKQGVREKRCFYCLTPLWKKLRLELANSQHLFCFSTQSCSQPAVYFLPLCDGKVFFCLKKKKNNRDLLCPAEPVWCLLLMRRLLHWAAVQISLLSRKYGFLTRRHPRLRTFHQSWSQSCFLGGDSDSAGPLQGCAALNAALVRPACISLPHLRLLHGCRLAVSPSPIYRGPHAHA